MLFIACSIALCLLVTFVLCMDAFIDLGLEWAHRLQRWLRPANCVRPRLRTAQPMRYLGTPESGSSEPVRSTEARF